MKWRAYGYREWHDWFAWYPVLCFNTKNWVWLEKVERIYHYTYVDYKEKEL